MSAKYDFLVVGAGLSGSVFAYERARRGDSVLVLEKRRNVGGNIRCEKMNGVIVHRYGAHIFHTSNKATWDYVNDKVELTPVSHNPVARTGDGSYMQLPFCLHTFHSLWPDVCTPEDARRRIDEQTREWRMRYVNPCNLEQKALVMVGQEIYEALIKGYTEKQWNMPCDKLAPEIITRIPLCYTWDASYFEDRYIGVPEKGYNGLIEALLADVDVMTGVDYVKEQRELEGVAKHVIYTGMIDELFNSMYGSLQYRSLRFDVQIEPLEHSQGCTVMNYTGHDVEYTRSIEHNRFAPNEYYEELVKTYEYPREYVPGESEPCYPVIGGANRVLYEKYLQHSKGGNILFCGRLGTYRYLDMDEAIEAAIRMAKLFD